MLKFKIDFEIDEERLMEMFENREVKFSKNKIKVLKSQMNENFSDWFDELNEEFERIVEDWIDNYFND